MAPLWPLTFSSGERPRALWALLFKSIFLICNDDLTAKLHCIVKLSIRVVKKVGAWVYFIFHKCKLINVLKKILLYIYSWTFIDPYSVNTANTTFGYGCEAPSWVNSSFIRPKWNFGRIMVWRSSVCPSVRPPVSQIMSAQYLEMFMSDSHST